MYRTYRKIYLFQFNLLFMKTSVLLGLTIVVVGVLFVVLIESLGDKRYSVKSSFKEEKIISRVNSSKTHKTNSNNSLI